jgi:hypothetical protein
MITHVLEYNFKLNIHHFVKFHMAILLETKTTLLKFKNQVANTKKN